MKRFTLTADLRAIWKGGLGVLLIAGAAFSASKSRPARDAAALRSTAAAPDAAIPQTPPAHSVALNWKASADSGVAYNIYRSMTSGNYSGAPLNGATPVTSTTYTDSTVTVGNKYFYVVRSVLNGIESSNSNEVSAVILPAPPTALTAEAQ